MRLNRASVAYLSALASAARVGVFAGLPIGFAIKTGSFALRDSVGRELWLWCVGIAGVHSVFPILVRVRGVSRRVAIPLTMAALIMSASMAGYCLWWFWDELGSDVWSLHLGLQVFLFVIASAIPADLCTAVSLPKAWGVIAERCTGSWKLQLAVLIVFVLFAFSSVSEFLVLEA